MKQRSGSSGLVIVILAAFFFLPVTVQAQAQAPSFPTWLVVDRVVSGSVIEVATHGAVRLVGIEPMGTPSRIFLEGLLSGSLVAVSVLPGSPGEPAPALIHLPDGRLLNAEMVRLGYARARVDPSFPVTVEFSVHEANARRLRRGLWNGPNNGPPSNEGSRGRTSTRPPVEFRVFGYAGTEMTSAAKSLDAVLGTNQLLLLGGGAEIILADRWLLRGTFSQFNKTGTRVFVGPDGAIFPLGIPLRITIRPLELSGGYRQPLTRLIALYAAAGYSRYAVKETSNDETEAFAGKGWHFLGGLEMKPVSHLLVAAEGQWTRTDEMLTGGVAAEFGESRLRGLRISGRIGFVF